MTSPRDDSKPALRRVLRASRPDLDSQFAQSTQIRQVLREWLEKHPAKVIASFFAIPGEPLLLPLMVDLPDRQWVLPRITGDSMEFHFTEPSLAGTAPGPFGISEPGDHLPRCPIGEIDLFLCPGMAFTPSGKRLGRGKGYYDRTLIAAGSESLRIGVCFREQLHPELPTDPHDLPMHFIATPDGIEESNS